MSSRTLLVSWQHGVTPSVDLNKLKTTNNTLTVQLFFYLQNHRTFHSEESWSTQEGEESALLVYLHYQFMAGMLTSSCVLQGREQANILWSPDVDLG